MGGGASSGLQQGTVAIPSSRTKAKSVLFVTGATPGKELFCRELSASGDYQYIDPRSLLPPLTHDPDPGRDAELIFAITMELLFMHIRNSACQAFIV